MIYKTNFLLKTYKRYINTKVLREALSDMTASSTTSKSQKLKEDIFRLDTMQAKTETIEKNNQVHEDILTNIQESENLLRNLREDLDLIKKTQLNLNIKVEKVETIHTEKIIDNLNDKTQYFSEKRNFMEINVEDALNFTSNDNTSINLANNIRKSVFDISWLQPFADFMHNHSTLVFTVGGGMLLGGILFLSNFGPINIGSLLARIGISLFGASSNSSIVQPVNSNPIHITIESSNISPENNTRQISSGFFKELGKKLLEMIDLYIEKLKDGRTKYK